MCGHPPFYSEQKYRPYITQGKFCRSPQWHSLSPEAKDLIQSMLQVDPDQRISISDILRHEWMTGRASKTELGKEYADRVYKLALREKLKKIFQRWELKQQRNQQDQDFLDENRSHSEEDVTGRSDSDISHLLSSHSFQKMGRISSSTSQTSSTPAASLSSLSIPPILPQSCNIGREVSTHRTAITTHLNNSKRWFDLLDKDKDGSITREELIEGVVAMLYEEDGQQQHQQEKNDENFAESLDPQHPSSSSASSSRSTVLSSCPAVHVNVEELFLVMDRNCSGTIDYQEFTHFYDMILQSSSMKMENEYEEQQVSGDGKRKFDDSLLSSTRSDTPTSFPDFDFNHSDSSREGATVGSGVQCSSRKRKESMS